MREQTEIRKSLAVFLLEKNEPDLNVHHNFSKSSTEFMDG